MDAPHRLGIRIPGHKKRVDRLYVYVRCLWHACMGVRVMIRRELLKREIESVEEV